MANGDRKNKQEPQLKVIDDDGEEVTRLGDAPSAPAEEPQPAKKRAPMRRSDDQLAAGTVMTAPEVTGDDVTEVLSKEEEIENPDGRFNVPPAVVAIVAGAFFLLLGLGLFLSFGGRAGLEEREKQSLKQKIEANRQKALAESEEARQIVGEFRQVIEGYCRAATVEEKARYVRHPERVTPLMEKYYKETPITPYEGDMTLREQLALPVGNKSFSVLSVGFDDGSQKIYLAEVDNDLKVRVDWESDVCYQPISIAEMFGTLPTEPFILRVYASPDVHYAYDFSDSSEYQSIKLTFRDSDEYLFAYAERGSEQEIAMHNHFKMTRSMQEPMLLELRYPENARDERMVIIDRFICPRWAYTDNPDDD